MGKILDTKKVNPEWLIDVTWLQDLAIMNVWLHPLIRIFQEWGISMSFICFPCVSIVWRRLVWKVLRRIPPKEWDVLITTKHLVIYTLMRDIFDAFTSILSLNRLPFTSNWSTTSAKLWIHWLHVVFLGLQKRREFVVRFSLFPDALFVCPSFG